MERKWMLAMKAVQPLFLAVDFFFPCLCTETFAWFICWLALTALCSHPLAWFAVFVCVVLVIWLLTMEIGDDAPVMMMIGEVAGKIETTVAAVGKTCETCQRHLAASPPPPECGNHENGIDFGLHENASLLYLEQNSQCTVSWFFGGRKSVPRPVIVSANANVFSAVARPTTLSPVVVVIVVIVIIIITFYVCLPFAFPSLLLRLSKNVNDNRKVMPLLSLALSWLSLSLSLACRPPVGNCVCVCGIL